jgi:hypothetical protein
MGVFGRDRLFRARGFGRASGARRLISVAAMLVGALAGALLVLHARIVYPLVIALVILVAVAVTGVAWSRATGSRSPWVAV